MNLLSLINCNYVSVFPHVLSDTYCFSSLKLRSFEFLVPIDHMMVMIIKVLFIEIFFNKAKKEEISKKLFIKPSFDCLPLGIQTD